MLISERHRLQTAKVSPNDDLFVHLNLLWYSITSAYIWHVFSFWWSTFFVCHDCLLLHHRSGMIMPSTLSPARHATTSAQYTWVCALSVAGPIVCNSLLNELRDDPEDSICDHWEHCSSASTSVLSALEVYLYTIMWYIYIYIDILLI